MGLIPKDFDHISNAHPVSPDRLNRIFAAAKEHQDALNLLRVETLGTEAIENAMDASSWVTAGLQSYLQGVGSFGESHWYLNPMKVGTRIVKWTAYVNEGSATAVQAGLFKINITTGTQTQIGSGDATPGSSAGYDELTDSPGYTTIADEAYYLRIDGGASASDAAYAVDVELDHDVTSVVPPDLVTGDLLDASDLNAVQDAIVDVDQTLRQPQAYIIGVGRHKASLDGVHVPQLHSSMAFWNPDSGATAIARVNGYMRLQTNERTTAVELFILEGASNVVEMRFYRYSLTTGVRTQIGSTQTSGTGGGNVTLSITGLNAYQDADEIHYIEGRFPDTGDTTRRIYGMRYTTDRPDSHP